MAPNLVEYDERALCIGRYYHLNFWEMTCLPAATIRFHIKQTLLFTFVKMRTLVVFLTSILCLSGFAQNWDFFPLDSLRCYTVNQQNRLMGIDVRDHENYKNDVSIYLDSFSNFTEIDTLLPHTHSSIVYYRNGNSDYGNKIVNRGDSTIIYFLNEKNREQSRDRFIFINDQSLGRS